MDESQLNRFRIKGTHLVLMAVGFLVIAGFVTWRVQSDRNPSDAARIQTLPRAAGKEGVISYLTGPGADLVTFFRRSEPLKLGMAPEPCRQLASDLDREFGPPAELLAKAGDAPDPVTREVFVNYLSAASRAFPKCGSGDEGDTLRFQAELVKKHLSDLGL